MFERNTRGRPEKLTEDRKSDIGKILEHGQNLKITKIYKQAVKIWREKISYEVKKEYPLINSTRLQQEIGARMPGYDTVRNYYNDIIKTNIDKLKGNPLDKPWSVGESIKSQYEITPDATNDLLAVWKFCLAIGHTFTIREAKWIAHIRAAIQPSENIYERREALLFGYGHEYALRERVSEISGSPMNTSDIDGDVCFQKHGFDWVVFRSLGLIPLFTIKGFNKELSEYTILPTFINIVEYAADQSMKTLGKSKVRQHIPSNISETQEYIVTALLSYLSKGPSWNKLGEEEYLAILDYLKDLVTRELVDDAVNAFSTIDFQYLDVPGYTDRPKGLAPEDVLDSELLRLVGYDVSIHEATIDNLYNNLYVGMKNPISTRYKAVFNPIREIEQKKEANP